MSRQLTWSTFALALLLGTAAHAQQGPEALTGSPAERPASAPASQPTSSPAERPASAPASQPTSSPAERPARDPYDPSVDSRGTPSLPPQEDRLPPPSAKPGERRPVPRYDGRADKGASAGEVLIWIPRVIGLPVHLVLEYLVRKPIVGGLTFAEKHHLFERVKRVFSFRDEDSYLFPTAFFDFGLNPTVGFFNVNNDLWVDDHTLTLQGGFWDGWVNLIATSRFPVFTDDSGVVTIRGQFFTRPDQVFHGVGAETLDDNERFYRLRAGEGELSLRAVLMDLNRIDFGVFFRHGEMLGQDNFGTSVESAPTVFDVDDPAQVPGFGKTYSLLSPRIRLELDTRSPDRVFTPGSGLRLELFGSFHLDPNRTELHFFRWGGEAAGFLDLSGINHVLALRVYAEFVEQTGDDPVPVPELIFLGGEEHLRGFLEGRLRGESAFVVTANYRYPVWTFLDANLFVSVGNVFSGHLDDLRIQRLHLNWGIGLRSNASRDVSFDAMVAFGTNRFDHIDEERFAVDHVRLIFGINQGF